MTTKNSLTCCIDSAKLGRELFNNPKYSDLTTTCQGHQWYAHKAILGPRCPFFAACIDGPFKEGQENRIDLPGDDPVDIENLIRHLYIGKDGHAIPCIPETPTASPEYLSSLFTTLATADKYFAWQLKSLVQERLADYLNARKAFSMTTNPCESRIIPAEFVRTRLRLIKMAYEWEVPGISDLRTEIVATLKTGWLPDLMKFDDMVETMLNNPQLGVDLLREIPLGAKET